MIGVFEFRNKASGLGFVRIGAVGTLTINALETVDTASAARHILALNFKT